MVKINLLFNRLLLQIHIILLVVFSAGLVFAQGVSVSANVDRNQMRPGDTFTYSISVSSENNLNMDDPKLPDLSAFSIVNSWSDSQVMGTFTNGQVQTLRTQNYKYMLATRAPGAFTIGAAEVTVGGQVFRTNPITIQVDNNATDNSQAQGVPQQRQRGGQIPPEEEATQGMDDIDDLFSQLLKRRNFGRGENIDPNEAFFIQLETDKQKVYQGEQITATWYLVTRAQIADIDTLKYPALTGFWKEDIELATRLNFRPEIINGVRYNKALLASFALFPIKPGKIDIDEYQAKCRVLSANAFGMPQEGNITKESKRLSIDVMALPAEGKPKDFTGAVGQFEVTSKIEDNVFKTNQPLAIKIRIDGVGNAKMADLPNVAWPEGIEVYDSKSQMKFHPNGRSFKDYEILLVPRNAGAIQLPEITFHFFDPVQKNYYSRSIPARTIDVLKGEGYQEIESSPLKMSEKNDAPDVRHLPEVLFTSEEVKPIPLAAQIGIWSGMYTVGFLSLFLYGFFSFRRKDRRENLMQLINRRLLKVNKLLSDNNSKEFSIELTNTIYSVLGEVAGLGGASYELSKLIERAPPSFRRDLAPEIQKLMSQLEIIAFAPEKIVGDLKSKKNLESLRGQVEKVLKKAAEYDFSKIEDK
jgi:hypothetical protein